MVWALLATGCNQYDLFALREGRAGSPDEVDLLFVVDNSSSMREESLALAESFSAFVAGLAAREEPFGTDGLGDAVDRYVAYVQDPAYFVDFQIGLTTIDARETGGALLTDPPVLRKGDEGLVDAFVSGLLCRATCFETRDVVPDDPGVDCDRSFDGEVSAQALDCLCGVDAWLGRCGGVAEEGLETTLDALCRAVEDPPPECFDGGALTAADAGTNAGLVREGATFVPVVVTDEGDASHRMSAVDGYPNEYLSLFAAMDLPMAWVVVSPALTEDYEVACGSTISSAGAIRYQYLAENTGGLKLDIQGTDCQPIANWAPALEQIGAVVAGGLASFRLDPPPVPRSIVVEVAGRAVGRARDKGEDIFGQPIRSSGWVYEEEGSLLVLYGDAVPDPTEDVEIWYLPAR